MKTGQPFWAGAAKRVINCEIGDELSGQFATRICEYIRDDLEANIIFLASENEKAILINIDHLGTFSAEFIDKCVKAIAVIADLPIENIMIFSTHTHAGPYSWDVGGHPINLAHLKKTLDALTQGVQEAIKTAVPAKTAAALGKALIGRNRRLCRQDGAHTMYGDARRADFTGLEGPDDPSQAVLALTDVNGNYIAIVHNNCAHATCVGSGNFASADFPGEARRQIRAALGIASLPVIYMQGASGDTCPNAGNMASRLSLEELGGLMATETLRLLKAMRHVDGTVMKIAGSVIEAVVRLPTPDMIAAAQKTIADPEASAMLKSQARGRLRINKEFQDNPVERCELRALRVGDFAAVFLPGEPFCQFGLDIKRRSPFPITAVAQLTGAYRCGYIPTFYGFLGGGYSADLAYSCRSEPATGYKIVEESSRLLNIVCQ